MLRIAVMVSGGGTNLQAIIDGIKDKTITNTEIAAVISNNADAYALTRAKDNGIEAICVSPKSYETRDEFNKALLEKVNSLNVDLVVLAGFLVKIPEEMVHQYSHRIINIHPSLIPSFCGVGFYGLHVHEAALAKGVKVTGATVHYVDEGMDTGEIIFQKAVEVKEGDTPEILQKRVMEEAEWKLDNGDEVLVPAPDYPLWTACVTLAGGKAVHYICDEQSEWYPDIDDIKKKVTDRTKAIVIINPNNPTGALYPKEVLDQIVEVAREHQLIIFSDEIYDRLVMDGEEHISIASLAPDLFCVTFSGLSKSHMIAGYRIGWMILSGNKSIAKDYMEGLNMLSNMRLCSNVPAQSIVQTALGGHQSVNGYIVPGGRIYEQREYIYKALNDIPGISAVKPKAAFYIFPKIDTKKFNIYDDEKFALDLLREKKILIIHGAGFNWGEPDHFRVVYLPRIEVLKDAVDKMEDFLKTYKQR